MLRAEEFFQLDQTLRKSGNAGQVLLRTLLHHFGDLIRDLRHNLDTEVSLDRQRRQLIRRMTS
ncbi:MAG: hypothetical protein OXD43_12935 [Bacteroidetes bacterium]|nr:hypothetical protein [Bacteroidota bacterium]